MPSKAVCKTTERRFEQGLYKNTYILGLFSNILCLRMKKTIYVYPLGKTDGYCRVQEERTQRNVLFTMGTSAYMERRCRDEEEKISA